MSVFVIFIIFLENHNIMTCCHILITYLFKYLIVSTIQLQGYSQKDSEYTEDILQRQSTEDIISRLNTPSRARPNKTIKIKGRDGEGAGSGKIKKSKEIRKGLPTLTFSGG